MLFRSTRILTLCSEVALQHGVKIRVSRPRPSARSKKYRIILRGPIEVPAGWLRIVDRMLFGLLRYTEATPISIDRIAMEDDHLRVAADNLTIAAEGIVIFSQAIARRTDKRRGALHVPTDPQGVH